MNESQNMDENREIENKIDAMEHYSKNKNGNKRFSFIQNSKHYCILGACKRDVTTNPLKLNLRNEQLWFEKFQVLVVSRCAHILR